LENPTRTIFVVVEYIGRKIRRRYAMEISLKKEAAQPVVYIRTHTSIDRLPELIGESYSKIMNYMQEVGAQPSGEPYTAYYTLDMQDLDVEMGFPIGKPLPSRDDIKTRDILPGQVASFMYKGPYSGMEPVYGEMFAWIAKKGLKPQGVYYEYYYNSPQDVPESELLTRIAIPVE
jgi:effector-binding domain-containing protein